MTLVIISERDVREYMGVSMWMSVCVNVWVWEGVCKMCEKKVDDDFIVNGFLKTFIF